MFPRVDSAMLKRIGNFLDATFEEWGKEKLEQYNTLMAYYKCAMMEIETKFNVLNEEFSLQFDRNPINSIKTRLKSFESIKEKLKRMDKPFSAESIEENLSDIAGVRVVCSFPYTTLTIKH